MTASAALAALFYLMSAHALCDFSLQSDSMARGKSRSAVGPVPWWAWLSAHAMIHGGAVAMITSVWWLGLAETAAHLAIDMMKCEKLISFSADQAMHFTCKVAWVVIMMAISVSQ